MHPVFAAALLLWSEFLSPGQVTSRLPELRAREAGLLVAVTPASIDSGEFVEIATQAHAEGVELRPWLLLSEEQGYWANQHNAPDFAAFARRVVAELEAHELRPSWITFDFEPRPGLLREVSAKFADGKIFGALKTLRGEEDVALFESAREIYSRLLDELHSKGIHAHAVMSPLVLHGNPAKERIARLLGLPFGGIAWDEISFMVYRPEFKKFLGPDVGPDLVYAYARRARARYGDRAAIDLGEIGEVKFPEPTPGFTDPADLHADWSAARAGGVERVHLYSLDGIEQSPGGAGLGEWIQAPPARKPKSEPKTRASLHLLDVLARLL